MTIGVSGCASDRFGAYFAVGDETREQLIAFLAASSAPHKAEVCFSLGDRKYELTFEQLDAALAPFEVQK